MNRSKLSIPTPAETKALVFLYQNGSATVREYHEQGNHPPRHAYTSVMSLLDVMYRKGLVTRTIERRAFRYKAALSQAELRSAVVKNILENVFGGNIEAFKAEVAAAKPGKKK
jgi:BlaI family transcriptional regulator, penicillinase repressor